MWRLRWRVCLSIGRSRRNGTEDMLKVLKVYRYRSSGKLIADLENGYVLPLNSDLTFSKKVPHSISRDTEPEATSTLYRIEVEVGTQGKHETYRIIRTWEIDLWRLLGATGFETDGNDALINKKHRSPKSAAPNAPIEDRIDISMSEEFSENEKQYVGQSAGHPAGFILMVASFFLLIMAGLWGWWPPILAFAIGVFVIWSTRTPGDSSKIKEVRDAKERLRKQEEKRQWEAMRDVQVWIALDGVQFEQAVAKIFREKGFDVEFTPRSNDKGVDLIIKKDGAVSIVQCKAYKKNVGVRAVRELVGVRASWPNAEEAFLVALFDFSRGAKEFAAEQNIKLVSIAKDYLKTDYRPDQRNTMSISKIEQETQAKADIDTAIKMLVEFSDMSEEEARQKLISLRKNSSGTRSDRRGDEETARGVRSAI